MQPLRPADGHELHRHDAPPALGVSPSRWREIESGVAPTVWELDVIAAAVAIDPSLSSLGDVAVRAAEAGVISRGRAAEILALT